MIILLSLVIICVLFSIPFIISLFIPAWKCSKCGNTDVGYSNWISDINGDWLNEPTQFFNCRGCGHDWSSTEDTAWKYLGDEDAINS
jgi:hypothetical protein